MDPDLEVRAERLALLSDVARLVNDTLQWSAL